MEKTKVIVVFAGPSGSGKTTLLKNAVKKYPEVFKEMRSWTTRDKRPGETDGITYDFVDDKRFDENYDNMFGRMEFHGKKYGTPMIDLNGKIGTVILNEAGLQDYMSVTSCQRLKGGPTVTTIIVGMTGDPEKLHQIRPDRSVESISAEVAVTKNADILFDITKDGYPTVDKFMHELESALTHSGNREAKDLVSKTLFWEEDSA